MYTGNGKGKEKRDSEAWGESPPPFEVEESRQDDESEQLRAPLPIRLSSDVVFIPEDSLQVAYSDHPDSITLPFSPNLIKIAQILSKFFPQSPVRVMKLQNCRGLYARGAWEYPLDEEEKEVEQEVSDELMASKVLVIGCWNWANEDFVKECAERIREGVPEISEVPLHFLLVGTEGES